MSKRLSAVRHYLSVEFPGATIEQVDNADTHRARSVFFAIDTEDELYKLEISEEFLDDLKVDEIEPELRRRRAAEMLRGRPGKIAFLTGEGWVER